MKTIVVAGLGYVGLTTAACLAQLDNRVIGFDIDREKVATLRSGQMTFSEPGLPELVVNNMRAGRLTFTADVRQAMASADMAFICVGTPSDEAGRADLTQVESTTAAIARNSRRSFITVLKSTTPTGTADLVAAILAENPPLGVHSSVVVNPEFLREGTAVRDFFQPDRVVVGSWDARAAEEVAALYSSIRCPVVITDPPSAQLIKYASNAFLATKISFINEIALVADSVGASVKVVAEGMGFDERIGPQFLEAGLGYGGSCFPKDVLALSKLAEDCAAPSALLHAVMDINARQRRMAVNKLSRALGDNLMGREVCVMGLAFKADTDDVRESPALEVISALCASGTVVRAYDPVAASVASRAAPPHRWLRYFDDAYEAAYGSNAIFIATDWAQIRALDWRRIYSTMLGRTIVDGRGLLGPEEMRAIGYDYVSVTG
ncbi:MAG: UDP-glucose/GDP-mannose dehydrogenase family protein [Candidatus Eremiobacteraeota bacterium]|nr:UDP-glucose/GDP-mannose dehydrogenase family protein [Candidatus Eremiobacteraeota bacterium]